MRKSLYTSFILFLFLLSLSSFIDNKGKQEPKKQEPKKVEVKKTEEAKKNA